LPKAKPGESGDQVNKFRGKTVLVTGHTGFKGSWLSLWLDSLGARVVGVALDPTTSPSLFEELSIHSLVEDYRIDLKDSEALTRIFCKTRPDFVFHLAAQSLVGESYRDPVNTMATNVIGTVNVLQALRKVNRKVTAILITSDKAYDNVEQIWGYREQDRLGGKDPYSASKGMAELAIRSYVESFFDLEQSGVKIGVARAGNVIGGGDWSVDRIVPDCMRAWAVGLSVEIRSPLATRPWQHVLEPLSGYLAFATALEEDPELHGEPFNFGPPPSHNYPVRALVKELADSFGKGAWIDQSSHRADQFKEASLLKLDCEKAANILKWSATLDFPTTAKFTADWYKAYYDKDVDLVQFTREQIAEYERQQRGKDLE
jgi:CDP-glucose 4,6-dehydratase